MPRIRSPFGKDVAKLRIERGLLLKDFADRIGVSPSRLSNVEFGERPVPEEWFEIISEEFDLTLPERVELKKSILRSKKNFNFSAQNDGQREVLVAFIEHFESIDEEGSKQIIEAVERTATGNEEIESVREAETAT